MVTTGAASDLLRIRLLGDLQLRRGSALVPLPPSRRTRALFGYLVANPSASSRSALCDLLWDGSDDPRASLRWSLTKLRAIVDDAQAKRLVADRERVAFDALRCEVDTAQVGSLLAGGIASAPLPVLQEAACLLQGEFLDGLDLPSCYRFHHWCMAERERHGTLRRGVLEALVARLERDPERALPYAHAMVAADPLAESAHAALVRLLAAAGRYPDAERHYSWARELLQREISMPAGGPLDHAIGRARRERRDTSAVPRTQPEAAPDSMADAPAASGVADTPALLGRDAERAAIEKLLAGRCRAPLLLFAGEPGIGKTRLLDHLAESAAAVDRRVIRGRCYEAEMVRPYGLWLDALRGEGTSGVVGETLARAAPLLAGHAAEGGSRESLFDAAAALVQSVAERQPLALLLDDLQWIDEGSAALLHFLARTLDADSMVLFAGAARAGEIDDNAWAKGLLQSLSRAGGLRRMDLGPLAEPEAQRLLGAAPVDTADAMRQSGGNPLYLIELARAAQRGADGTGRSIDALIDERLLSLDDGARDLLAWAAALGRELRPDLLAAASGRAVTDVLARLERFERRGLIATTRGGQFDFAHDLVRQRVYQSLSQPRRRAIHRQIAHALIVASASEPLLHGEIVRHAGLAGDALAAARACLAAGEHCLRVFANIEAASVAERGLACVGELQPGAECVRLEIGLLRVRIAVATGAEGWQRSALASRAERAIEAAEALSLPAQAASGWELMSFLCQQNGDTGGAREATLAAQRVTRRADATTHCLQLANSGRCLLDIDADPVQARALINEAAALAGELGLDVMELEWGRGLIDRADGALEAACRALARAVALARRAENHWRENECMIWLATAELEDGRFADVLAHVEEIIDTAARMGEAAAPFVQTLAALAQLHQGDRAAESGLAASILALRELDDKSHLAYALNEAAAFALAAGQPEVAANHAREALTAAQAVRRTSEIAVAKARLAAATNDPQGAAESLNAPPAGGHSARAIAALEAATRGISTIASTVAAQAAVSL